MFSTFWILYLTSYVGEYLEDDDEVSNLYAKLMIISVVFGLAFSPLIGYFSDRTSPLVSIPLSFLLRASSIGLFIMIKNPTHIYAFAVGTLLVVGTTCEQICADSVLMRNAEKEIRGVIYGTAIACGYFGQLILCLVGGWLFDHVGPKTPFFFVGILDVICAISCVILGCCGVIKNDIAERKEKAEQEQKKLEEIRQRLLTANKKSEQEDEAPEEAEGPGSPDSLVGIDYAAQGFSIND